MNNLVIDIGNTRIKYGIFADGQLVHQGVEDELRASDLFAWVTNHTVQNIIYSSVAGQPPVNELAQLANAPEVMELTASTPLPFVNAYATPTTLGKDRLAAVAGAASFWPDTDCLVVDAGTCVTLDVLTADGRYLGGNIAPGVQMRLRAMHEHTARLPLVPAQAAPTLWGTSTIAALQNGGVLGTALEIEAFAQRLRQMWPTLRIILTGGDAQLLANCSEYEIFVRPNLVLYGLNHILTFNINS